MDEISHAHFFVLHSNRYTVTQHHPGFLLHPLQHSFFVSVGRWWWKEVTYPLECLSEEQIFSFTCIISHASCWKCSTCILRSTLVFGVMHQLQWGSLFPLSPISSLPPISCGVWELNACQQPGVQTPLLTEPSPWLIVPPLSLTLLSFITN